MGRANRFLARRVGCIATSFAGVLDREPTLNAKARRTGNPVRSSVIAAASLVIARSGASTVAELTAVGRPAILVPLPHALDQDQSANAAVLERSDGAIRLLQNDFTPDRLAREISALAGAPERLVAMAAAARSEGALDAAERLADLVGEIMGVAQ